MGYAPQSKENSNPQHQQHSTKATTPTFADERESTTAISPLQAMMANSPQQQKLKSTAQLMANSPAQQRLNTTAQTFATKPEPIQRLEDEEPLQAKADEPVQREQAEAPPESSPPPKPNNTGLPDNLKTGIENLSGMSMDHVKVHFNSDKPAQLQAHAYAQGSEIHVAPGQEQHLPHEAWHVVQQAQGRVKPTVQMKGDVQINDDVGLEVEADVMGAKALSIQGVSLQCKQHNDVPRSQFLAFASANPSEDQIQRVEKLDRGTKPGTKLDKLIIEAYSFVIPWLEEAADEAAPYSPKAKLLLKNFSSGVTYYVGQSTEQTEPMATLTLTMSNLINYTIRQLNVEIDNATKGDLVNPPEDYVSPYTSGIDKYDGALKGAVVRVEDNFVVVVEHYQLKHNADLGILSAGGPFLGKSGSTLRGGWAAHTNIYSVEVLAAAKLLVAGLTKEPGGPINPAKQRLSNIDAYLTIIRDQFDWVITYHGNPPE